MKTLTKDPRKSRLTPPTARPRRPPRGLPANRRGTAAVEFALIAPLMLTFTFGLIELGRITLVKEAAVQATREGAREAIRPAASVDEVMAQVNRELQLMNVTDATVAITPNLLEDAEPGSLVTVRVEIPISSVTWVPGYFQFGATDIVAETTMRRESTN